MLEVYDESKSRKRTRKMSRGCAFRPSSSTRARQPRRPRAHRHRHRPRERDGRSELPRAWRTAPWPRAPRRCSRCPTATSSPL